MITVLKENNENNSAEALYNKCVEKTDTIAKNVIDMLINRLEHLKDDFAINVVQSEVGPYHFDGNDIDLDLDTDEIESLKQELETYNNLSDDSITDKIKYELNDIIEDLI